MAATKEPPASSASPPKKKQFHRKKRTGCVQCVRVRRIKCDEGRPVCQNCIRTGNVEGCHYPISQSANPEPQDGNKQHSQLDSTSIQSFQKKFHTKSKTGCTTCKRRHVRCDETLPSCINCIRIKASCSYSTTPAPTRNNSLVPSFKLTIPLRLHLVELTDHHTSMAFEYFHLYIVPMFQACHPSNIWTSTLGYSIQTDPAVRRIALALGSQQWMMQAREGSPIPWNWTCPNQSEAFYGQAVYSLRDKLQNTTIADAPTIIFCCVLCVALECLRGSPKNVVLHLDNAVRIISQTVRSHQTSIKDMHDLVCLVQAMCASAWAYCAVPESTADYAVRMRSMDFRRLCNISFPQQSMVPSMDVHSIVLELICTLRQLMQPNATPQDRLARFEEMYRLQARCRRVRHELLSTQPDSAARGFLESKLIMTQLFLDSTLTASRNTNAEIKGFGAVLDLLESSLERWQENSYTGSPYPFTLTSGAIHTLETIIRTRPDELIVDRAKELLKICPPREGLWTVGSRSRQR